MRNVFSQFDKNIKQAIKEELSLIEESNDLYSIDSIYFPSYFYLTKRFGEADIEDEYKNAGVWWFYVKEFKIRVKLDSSDIRFDVFSNKPFWKLSFISPSDIKSIRLNEKFKNQLIVLFPSKNHNYPQEVVELTNSKYKEYLALEKEDPTYSWIDFATEYNNKITGFSSEDAIAFDEKYGKYHYTSHTRFALKTLRQFLRNMLVPVWVRDVAYNIKGRDEYIDFDNENNISIKRVKREEQGFIQL